MGFPYEDQLVTKLQERDDLQNAITEFDKKKKLINEQIKQWLEINKLDKYTVEHADGVWTLSKIKTKRKSVTDYDVLIKKLGDEASIFITESEVEQLRVNKKK
jgi:hypothetical protein